MATPFCKALSTLGKESTMFDWMMRDRAERVCSSNWDTEASLPTKDKQMALDIAPNVVEPADSEPFKQEPPVEREQGEETIRRNEGTRT